MSQPLSLFSTLVHRVRFSKTGALNDDIIAAAITFADDDEAGQRWSEDNSYPGYTSYGSFSDLPVRAPCFAALKKLLDAEASSFAKALCFDLNGGKLKLDNLWINILDPGGFHSGHIHPHSVISGTYYALVPDGAAALKLEDPRLPMMMAAPTRTSDAPQDMRSFVYLAPEPGMMLMWESWLRHEVVRNGAGEPRISVSFNYRWD
ncbi:MAG: TIGR02466 family protein [Pseudomonadota bacterium]